MSETVQAAKERLTQHCPGMPPATHPMYRDDLATLLADHARLEGENERLAKTWNGQTQQCLMNLERNYDVALAALTESRREVSELREGLKPFAEAAEEIDERSTNGEAVDYDMMRYRHVAPSVGDFRRAAALLQRGEQPGGESESWKALGFDSAEHEAEELAKGRFALSNGEA